jgi:hypothetical protein
MMRATATATSNSLNVILILLLVVPLVSLFLQHRILLHEESSSNTAALSHATCLQTSRSEHPHAGARDAKGCYGYTADPTVVRRVVRKQNQTYWERLSNHNSDLLAIPPQQSIELLIPEIICGMPPGKGYEADGGYKLLTEKIQIHPPPVKNDTIRLLCIVYTYPGNRDLYRSLALTWGYQCDGFLGFSTETIPQLGLVDLPHLGKETYSNIWQKVRSIWAYVHDNYLDDYDFVHICGDDVYMMVNNMRRYLTEIQHRQSINPHTPLYLGQWVPVPSARLLFVHGGPGYTLNRVAIQRFVRDALPNCAAEAQVSDEDRNMARCMREIGILPGDSRELNTGEQQYHDLPPSALYIFRPQGEDFYAMAARMWERLEMPVYSNVVFNSSIWQRYENHKKNNSEKSIDTGMELVGKKYHLQVVAKYSITFHHISCPAYMARIHAISHKLCPIDTPLGHDYTI